MIASSNDSANLCCGNPGICEHAFHSYSNDLFDNNCWCCCCCWYLCNFSHNEISNRWKKISVWKCKQINIIAIWNVLSMLKIWFSIYGIEILWFGPMIFGRSERTIISKTNPKLILVCFCYYYYYGEMFHISHIAFPYRSNADKQNGLLSLLTSAIKVDSVGWSYSKVFTFQDSSESSKKAEAVDVRFISSFAKTRG